MNILTADVGSTFTKLLAVDIENRRILAASKAFTTIETNVMDGFNNALDELKSQTGNIVYDKMLAASSAAGGLKMVSVGLVPDLTAKASQLAAMSAGAKVIKTYSYELTLEDSEEINSISPDIILLSGGIDGGNKDVIIKNAGILAEIDGNFSVIAAGNKTASRQVSEILSNAHKEVIVCENVMPEFNKLNIMPAKRAIRDLFIKNIISAKGLSELQGIISMEIIPTPLAVFNAAELFSKGTKSRDGLGDLMVFDIGGATTDVYSMASGAPIKPNTVVHGLPEPFAKRTVEGDIGMRYSLIPLTELAGIPQIAARAEVTEAEVISWVEKCKSSPGAVPMAGTPESAIDDVLASFAAEIAAERHSGFVEKTYTVAGEMFLQTGKDLTGTGYVIGTGGQAVNSQNPVKILEKAAYSINSPFSLKPISPEYLLDKKYCFSAMGLISQIEPEAALEIMMNEFAALQKE